MQVDRSDDKIRSWSWRCLHYLSESKERVYSLFIFFLFFFRLLELSTRIIIKEKKNEKKRQHKGEFVYWLHLVSHYNGQTKNAKRTHTYICMQEKGDDFVQIKKKLYSVREKKRRRRREPLLAVDYLLPVGHVSIYTPERKTKKILCIISNCVCAATSFNKFVFYTFLMFIIKVGVFYKFYIYLTVSFFCCLGLCWMVSVSKVSKYDWVYITIIQ